MDVEIIFSKITTVIMIQSTAFLSFYFSWRRNVQGILQEKFFYVMKHYKPQSIRGLPFSYHCEKEIKLKCIQYLILYRELAKSFICIMTLNSQNLTKWVLLSLLPLSSWGDSLRGSGFAKITQPIRRGTDLNLDWRWALTCNLFLENKNKAIKTHPICFDSYRLSPRELGTYN